MAAAKQDNTQATKASLWDQAYTNFASNNPKLDAAFREIATAEVKSEENDQPRKVHAQPRGSKQTEFVALLEKKIQRMEQREWKIRLGPKFSFSVRGQIDRIFSILNVVRDLGSQAASLDPVHAGLPVTALYIILGFVSGDKQCRETLISGLERVSDVVRYFAVLEKVFLEEAAPSGRTALGERIVALYEHVLEFEALAICQCNHNTAYQTFRNLFNRPGWQDKIATIEVASRKCESLLSVVNQESGAAHRQKLELLLERQLRVIEKQVQQSKDSYQELLDETRNAVEAQLTIDERTRMQQCMQALRTTEYEDTKTQVPDRVADTCNWFLKHDKYKMWLADQPTATMWLTANPGCGKSVLSKYLVDEFTDIAGEDTSVCYFFFKARGEAGLASNALCALLHQLFEQNQNLLKKHGLDAYAVNGKNLSAYFNPLWRLLEAAHMDEEAGSIIYILDGLDECEAARQKELISRLFTLCSKPSPNRRIKLLITGRPIDELLNVVKDATRGKADTLIIELAAENHAESNAITREIDIVIDEYVRTFRKRREDLVKDDVPDMLRDGLTRYQNRTYLWVSLIIPRVLENATAERAELLEIIQAIPETVEDAYQDILDRVPARDTAQLKKLMQIVIVADRPLSLREMKAALSIARNTPYQELEQCAQVETSSKEITISKGTKSCELVELVDYKLFRERIRRLGRFFVRITHDDHVALIHETAADFILAPDSEFEANSQIGDWKNSFSRETANLTLASSCIWYLGLSRFDEVCWAYSETAWEREPQGASLAILLQKHSFLEYAASNWVTHFNLSGYDDPSEELMIAVAGICKADSNLYRTWIGISHYWTFSMRENETDLGIAIQHGIVPLTHYLLKNGTGQINDIDNRGKSTLHVAVAYRQVHLLALLINLGADVNITALDGSTPLHDAAMRGDGDAMKILLEADALVDARDEDGRTPLHDAAMRGHGDAIKILLEADALVNALDEEGRTPLYSAMMMYRRFPDYMPGARGQSFLTKRLDCVKLLLEKGATILNIQNGHEDDGEKIRLSFLPLLQDVQQYQPEWAAKVKLKLDNLANALGMAEEYRG